MPTSKSNFTVVLVTTSWNRKVTVKVKARNKTKVEAKALVESLYTKCFGCEPDYRVLGPVKLKNLMAEVKETQAKRRAAGAKRAAETRKRDGTKPHFILCPTCQSKSKMLHTEMGGFQTRRCKRGHHFTYDKWIGDRAAMALIFNGVMVSPYGKADH